MANTYTQVYIHLIFSVKNRMNSIPLKNKNIIHKYITGIVQNKQNKLIAINSMPDHIHILVGLHPEKSISSLVHDIKMNSTKFINEKQLTKGKFYWQDGYGAFSYSRSQIGNVIKYINNQETHHQKKTFQEEYIEILKKFEINYNHKYVFEEN